MSDKKPEGEKLPLTVFANKEWFKNFDGSSFWLRIYTLIGPKFKDLPEHFKEFPIKYDLGSPIKISYCQMGDFKFPISKSHIINNDGQTLIKFEITEGNLANSTYVCVGTPYQIDGNLLKEFEVKRTLDQACALMHLHFGRNLLFELIFEGSINMKDGNFSSPGPACRIPHPYDGPYTNPLATQGFIGAIESFASTSEEIKRKISLALDFVERAFREEEPFFNYWTALEILCGKSGAIQNSIKEHYGLRNLKQVDQCFGFKIIAQWRHDFTHHGIRPPFPMVIEKYMQMLIIDMVQWRLGLSKTNYLKNFISEKEIDLSILGLKK